MPLLIKMNASDDEWHPVLLVLKDTSKKVLRRRICWDFVDLQQIDAI